MNFFTRINNALGTFADFALDALDTLPLADEGIDEALRFDVAPGEDGAIRDALEVDMAFMQASSFGTDDFDLLLGH